MSEIVEELDGSTKYAGIMTGVPSYREGQTSEVIRAMSGEDWWYLVTAQPVKDDQLIRTELSLKEVYKTIQPYVSATIADDAESDDTRREVTDPYFRESLSCLDHNLKRIRQGNDSGMWKTSVYFGTPTKRAYLKLSSKLRGGFFEQQSECEPIRITRIFSPSGVLNQTLRNDKPPPHMGDHTLGLFSTPNFSTPLTSREMAVLVNYPDEEMPGFDVYSEPRFAVNAPIENKEQSILLGHIVDRGTLIANDVCVGLHALVKHGLIVGQTGYGKTRASFNLLNQLWNRFSIPWLVIEPVKNEYRRLHSTIPDLRVFTLGNEDISRFRMNPFEVPPNVRVQSHVDMLVSIMTRVFSMWTSLPHILESCIIKIYKEKGWDLAHDVGGPAKQSPTLSDLYGIVQDMQLPYPAQSTEELRAALLVRTGSLMQGGKGKMLNCTKGIPVPELLAAPTVLELKDVQDDDQKALLMAILFGTIYEYFAANCPETNSLKHFTVLEEAHRILENIQTEVSSEFSGHPRAKLVANLCNMLAEVRSYGEGILVVNQIPTKLAPDAIKNVSLKLIFHTEYQGDKEVMAKTLNLNETQMENLTHLAPRESICLFEGLHGAIKLRIPSLEVGTMDDNKLSSTMDAVQMKNKSIWGFPVRPFVGCGSCDEACDHRLDVESLARDKGFTKTLNNLQSYSAVNLQIEEGLRRIGLSAGSSISRKLCVFVQAKNAAPYWKPDRDSIILGVVKHYKDYLQQV